MLAPFEFHPRIAIALDAFREAGTAPAHIVCAFSFPPLAPDDYGYDVHRGGGWPLDLGTYAMAADKLFFAVHKPRFWPISRNS